MNLDHLGSKVRNARKNGGYNFKEIADKCHISEQHLRNIEASGKYPSLDVFIHLCDGLSVSPNFMLDYIPDPDETDNEMEHFMAVASLLTERQRKYIETVMLSFLEYVREND